MINRTGIINIYKTIFILAKTFIHSTGVIFIQLQELNLYNNDRNIETILQFKLNQNSSESYCNITSNIKKIILFWN